VLGFVPQTNLQVYGKNNRFSDKPPWLAATTNYENLNPANPVGL
jgi:hypothetical protein